MDMVFNELSIHPLANNYAEVYERILSFVNTFKKAKEFQFNKIRFDQAFDQIELTSGLTLNDFCNKPPNRTLGVLLRGLTRYPFIDDDSDEEKNYIENSFFLIKDNIRSSIAGLAAAYIYGTIGIGFLSENFWNQFEYQIEIEGEKEIRDTVLCAAKAEHFDTNAFIDWYSKTKVWELSTSLLVCNEKYIHLRDDHGKDVLKIFAQKLLQSPYIDGIINSLPFNPRSSMFIKRIYPDGKIEIILNWTDPGYGMIVQTTGRNIWETKEIAKIINDQFNKS